MKLRLNMLILGHASTTYHAAELGVLSNDLTDSFWYVSRQTKLVLRQDIFLPLRSLMARFHIRIPHVAFPPALPYYPRD